jgi:cytochrome bd-type quinol oxidase subunit 1
MLASSRSLLLVAKMRAFRIAAIIAVLAVPAHAQMGHSKGGGKLGQKSDEQIAAELQKKKNEENAYKDAVKKIPDQPVKQKDPWANMR